MPTLHDKNPAPRSPKPPEPTSDLIDESDLMTLVELQQFLADEISGPESSGNFSRAFVPLTDGLGLQSPPRRETAPHVQGPVAPPTPPPMRPPAIPIPKPRPEPESFGRPSVDAFFGTDPLPPVIEPPPKPAPVKDPVKAPPAPKKEPPRKEAPRKLADAIEGPVPGEPRPNLDTPLKHVIEKPVPVPPPAPLARLPRRALSGLLDQVFVLTLFAASLVVTHAVLNGGQFVLSVDLFKEFVNPLFVRFAALEFATLWLAYLAISLGLADRTFGMWVWGTRVSYTVGSSDNRFLKRILRVFLSFVFFAPIAPMVLLVVSWKGRNLLDFLSRTAVYRA